MNFNEIKNLEKNDLRIKLNESKKTLMDMKLKNSMGRLQNTSEIKKTRRLMARFLTALSQKG